MSHTIIGITRLKLCINVNNSLSEFAESLYSLLRYSRVYMVGTAGVLVTNYKILVTKDKIQAHVLVVAVYCLSVQNFDLGGAEARLCQKMMVCHRHGRNALQLAIVRTL